MSAHVPVLVGAVTTALCCTSLHRLHGAVIFYPSFYPNWRRSGVEVSYLLVTAANWSDQRELLPAFQAGHAGRQSATAPGNPGLKCELDNTCCVSTATYTIHHGPAR